MSVIAPKTTTSIHELSINTIRALAMDAVELAQSGHPGAPMGLAPAAYVLWTRIMRHDPEDPAWPNRDRFVLSAGHASMLLYAMLHLTGYDLSIQDLRRFRQLGSRTPGHPEYRHTPGVETTTGPLGQGVANAVGMAIAERIQAERFNRPGHAIIDHRTFVICSDGDLMEGISSEACSLAGHLRLSKLVMLYDDNKISIDGPTDIAFGEDVGARFRAYGWNVIGIEDGSDLAAIEDSFRSTAGAGRPTLIMLRTHIAHGAPSKQDTAAAHGAPLGPEEVAATKRAMGWPQDQPFAVPAEVRHHMQAQAGRGHKLHMNWLLEVARYRREHTEIGGQFVALLNGIRRSDPLHMPSFQAGTKTATRKASGAILSAVWEDVPTLAGGSADLSESTDTKPKHASVFTPERAGRFIHFGVREHAMGGILNGMALHGGLRPFGGTFLVFSDYMKPSIRLAALMRLPVIYVFTHDSIGLGEDGPTHQPVEHLAALRAIPGLTVIRPADATETAEAWQIALSSDGPVALILSRQDLPVLSRANAQKPGVTNGAYILRDSRDPRLILIATGSEVALALGAADILETQDIPVRVVSMPSWELFESQTASYRRAVLPPDIPRMSIEAAATFGWSRWTGNPEAVIGIDHFGASAPGSAVMAAFGFSAENVTARAKELLA